jgi:hypothetical protein
MSRFPIVAGVQYSHNDPTFGAIGRETNHRCPPKDHLQPWQETDRDCKPSAVLPFLQSLRQSPSNGKSSILANNAVEQSQHGIQ